MSGDRLRELFDQHAELPGDGQPVQALTWEMFEAAARALLAEAQPVSPPEPTDEQLDKTLFKALRDYMEQESPFGGPTDEKQLDRAKARAVLRRWSRPAPEPVSVAERLRLVAAGIRCGYMAGHDATVEGRYADPEEVAAECATQVLQEQADG